MAELKKQRAALKAKLTKFINFINDEDNREKANEIQCRLKKIEPLLDEFESVQGQIEPEAGQSSIELEEFEKTYYSTLGHAHDLIQEHNEARTTNILPDRISTSTRNNEPYDIKLPHMELTQFNGEYDDWLNFRNSFMPLVHENEKLSGIQKLHYLRSCLGPTVIPIISALETSEENYREAWDLLEERYDNKRLIVQQHVKIILELPSILKESAHELQRVIDTIRTHLRALKSLGEPIDAWDTLLIPIITGKIDRNTHREWEKSMTGSKVPKLSELLLFVEQRCQILRATSLNLNNASISNPNAKKPTELKKQVFALAQQNESCAICDGEHRVYACDTLSNLEVKDRIDKIRSARLCFNCLRPGHRGDQCRSTKCRKCGKAHNTLLHMERTNTFLEKESNDSQDEENDTSNNKLYSTFTSSAPNEVMLATAVVDLKGRDGKLYAARILVDNCAQSNFITARLANLLNWPQKSTNLPVESLNSVETRIKSITSAELFSRYNQYHKMLEFLVSPVVCERLPNHYINKESLSIPFNIKLADPTFNQPREIDALIGAEIYYDLLCVGQIRIPGQEAVLQKTKLGWIVGGRLGAPSSSRPKCMLTCDAIQKQLTRFWEVEEMDERKFLSEEEARAESHFKENTRRDPVSGRYIVRLPFNKNIEMLGESRVIAERRFCALERRLSKDTSLKAEYVKCMREAIILGHMREIKFEDIREKHYYLPHHPVIKESSTTTKVRIVFNASAPSNSGISLNHCLDGGPIVQNSSLDITLRARTHQIIIMADIEKMYKQIKLDERDEQYQLIYWRENESDELKTFVIPVVCFGNGAASHHSTSVLNLLADQEATKFPMASIVLKRDTYVDDVMSGADSTVEALELRDQLINLAKAGGFTLRKWISNDVRIIKSLPEDLHDIRLLHEKNNEMKTLGIQWDRIADQITYKISVDNDCNDFTKRQILSDIARLYDPLGLLGPVIVAAKIVMQDLWKIEVKWDESLPQNIHTAWHDIKTQLPDLNNIRFNRKAVIAGAHHIELHGFSDASEKAYGACVYMRSINQNGKILVNLLCSKNRVAPVKTISIPKLELCAALLLAKLIKSVLKAMCKRINEIYLWSDSSITLQWIKTHPSSLKTFVANRVAEIREITNSMYWRHVPSQENAADVLSRGQLPTEFVKNDCWKNGPS